MNKLKNTMPNNFLKLYRYSILKEMELNSPLLKCGPHIMTSLQIGECTQGQQETNLTELKLKNVTLTKWSRLTVAVMNIILVIYIM